MHILLFEGIPTSGKTRLIEMVAESLKPATVKVISEDKTWMPLLENKDPKTALDHLIKIVSDIHDDTDYLLVDRMHLTHAFKTASPIQFFKEVDTLLVARQAKLVLLTIDKAKISEQIQQSLTERTPSWAEHVKKKGSDKDIYNYYASQQETLANLATQTHLPLLMVNTSGMNWSNYAQQIVAWLNPHRLYPLIAAGALILNKDRKLFLMQSSGKFGSEWIVPGGKVSFGELAQDALVREIKEETNLNLYDIEYLGYRDYPKPNKHFLFLEYLAYTDNPEEVQLNYESTGYGWFDKREIAELNIAKPTKSLISERLLPLGILG